MSADFIDFLKWYLAVGAAGLLAWPLGFAFFRHMPDRGYAFLKPLGLLAIGYTFWLLASLGFLRNDAAGLLVAAGVVLALGLAWLRRPGLWYLREWLLENRALVIGVEVVFLAAFALWAWVRAHNPDIVATEKPMEFMFINSILRSPAFPPNDAWLSGHAISYYYFGYVMIAGLIELSGTAPAVAFNLGIALLFALTATGALGVALNLIALAQRDRAQAEREAAPPAARAFWPGLLGPLFVVIVGNFYGVVRLAHHNAWFADLELPAVRYDFGTPRDPNNITSLSDFLSPPGVRADFVNVYSWLDLKGAAQPPTLAAPPERWWDAGFWWWFNGARVTHDRDLVGRETEAITELPIFSFILGDMHPHVLALPFVFLAIAVGLEWLLWAHHLPARALGVGPWDLGFPLRALAPALALSALALGGLSFLNTWDLPIYWFLTVAALTLGLGWRWGWDELRRRWLFPIVFGAALLAASLIAYLPFYFAFQSQAGGILPNLIYPTRFQQTVVMFGPVLLGVAALMAWLAVRARAVIDRRAAWGAGLGLVAALVLVAAGLTYGAALNPDLAQAVDGALRPLTRDQALGLMIQRRLVDSLTTILAASLIGLAVGLAIGAIRRLGERPFNLDQAVGLEMQPLELVRHPAMLMVLAMVLTGGLLLIGPEFVYLSDLFGTRMNTIFKFYYQVWTLWALAAAFGVWYILAVGRARLGTRIAFAAIMALAVLAGLAYTVPGALSRMTESEQRVAQPTLDGMAYFAQLYPDDWAAIEWLNRNVAGAPVIAESIGGVYWIEGRFSRFSMATGLPTPMGWPGHESQWRGKYIEKVAGREGEIRVLYQTRNWDEAQAILDKYQVEYVVLSGLERQKYGLPPDELNPFVQKFERNMRRVYPPDGRASDVTIYQRLQGSGAP